MKMSRLSFEPQETGLMVSMVPAARGSAVFLVLFLCMVDSTQALFNKKGPVKLLDDDNFHSEVIKGDSGESNWLVGVSLFMHGLSRYQNSITFLPFLHGPSP